MIGATHLPINDGDEEHIWFVVWNMNFMIFHNIWEFHDGNFIIPTDELYHFSEGWRKTTKQTFLYVNSICGVWFPMTILFFRYVFHRAAQPAIRVDYLSHPADPAAVIWSWRRSYWAIQWWLGWPLSCKGIFDPTMASRHISPPLIIMCGGWGAILPNAELSFCSQNTYIIWYPLQFPHHKPATET